jgi:nitrous oxidase accessory protein
MATGTDRRRFGGGRKVIAGAAAVAATIAWLAGWPGNADAARDGSARAAARTEATQPVVLSLPARPGSRQIVVSPDGGVASITAALDLAEDGDRIVVRAGVYREPTITVEKSVELIGEGWPVLDGEGSREIMVIYANDVIISGLLFRNVGRSMIEDRAALRVAGAAECRIEGNIFEEAFFGVYLQKAGRCTVAGNLMSARGSTESTSGNGVHVYSSRDVTVRDNRITGFRDGIYLEFSRGAVVERNRSKSNVRYGLHFMYSDSSAYRSNHFADNNAGVAVMYSHHVEMVGNEFLRNRGSGSYGLLLKEVYDARLAENRFAENSVALLADGAGRIIVDRNEFRRNGWAIKLMASTTDGRFTRNNFLGNSFDVSTNSRQNSNTFEGNFWEEYGGYDLDRDGVGDVPHRPVRLFSLVVEENAPAMIVLRSLFVALLDRAERVVPALTPATLLDTAPSMRAL